MNIFKQQCKKLCNQDYYHAFNIGVNAALLFHDKEDYVRFLTLLYVANNTEHFIFRHIKPEETFTFVRLQALVDVFAYCLLPDRFHIIMREKKPKGVQYFIHKVSTSYCMYYNKKYGHKGAVLDKTYRSRRVTDNNRLRQIISRVHLYPFSAERESRDSDIKLIGSSFSTKSEIRSRIKSDMEKALDVASSYEYSSMRDYLGENRPQKAILNMSSIDD